MKRLISIRIEIELFKKLKRLSQIENISFSKIVREKLNKNSKIELKGDNI